jgi:hypothetical protein
MSLLSGASIDSLSTPLETAPRKRVGYVPVILVSSLPQNTLPETKGAARLAVVRQAFGRPAPASGAGLTGRHWSPASLSAGYCSARPASFSCLSLVGGNFSRMPAASLATAPIRSLDTSGRNAKQEEVP